MKYFYTYLSIGIFFLASLTTSAQVLITEDFDASTSLPSGWSSGSLPPFSVVSALACDGANSARGTLSSSSTAPILQYLTQVTTGEDIVISFDYKLLQNTTGNPATDENFGSFFLEYTVDNGATWDDYFIINSASHAPSTNCVTLTHTIPAIDVPAGSDFGWRIRGNWTSGNNYIYIDNFNAIEQVDCIQPTNIVVEDITFDSIEISWDEMNTPDAMEWNVAYCPEGILPGNPVCFGSIDNTTNNPHTIINLNDGTIYDIYVQAVCGPGDVSAWTGPISVQTVAIGSDCANAFEIPSLPFTHTSDTEIYGNNYTGSPGSPCLGNNYLQGYDVVYHFTPATDDLWKIELYDLVGEDNVGFFLYEACSDIGSACVDGATTTTGNDFELDVFVTGGQDYYIVVSTAGVNTTTDYTISITGFDCATWQGPDGNSAYDFVGQTLGEFNNTNQGVQTTISFADLQWYEDDNGAPGTPIADPSQVILVDGDVYWVNQILGTCDSPYLMVTFNEFDCLNNLAVLTTDTGDDICDSGSTVLGATANSGNLFWYASETGGDIIGTGNSFDTGTINATTSFWVSEAFVGEGINTGQAKPGPTTVATSTLNNYGVFFNATSDFTLVDVQVFSTAGGGAVTVELRETSGALPDQTTTVSIPSGSTASPTPYTIPLEFEVSSGYSYRLIKTNGTGPAMIYATAANSNFPYPIGTAGEVTSGATLSGTTTAYYYFFNWTIREQQPLCESPRTEVIATVYEIFPINVTADSMTVCVGESTMLHATSTDLDFVYEWTWTDHLGNPQSDTGDSIEVDIVENTTFTVTGFNPITGCEGEATISIDAIGAGEIPVVPEQMDLCVGETIELFAGGVYHSFEETINDWTTVNNSTAAPGLNAAAAGWKLVNSPHNPANGASSNDNSQFYISVSDYLGPGGQLNTELISPPINLVGVQNVSVRFYHYYEHMPTQSTTARVQVSESQGPWTTLQTYTTTQGSPTNFAQVNFNLNSYTGSSDVRIRFQYTGGWGWWWAVDNVTIIRDYINGQVIWSGDNLEHLYMDPDATVPYTGGSSNSVYFNSETEGAYTYTVSLDIVGCTDEVTNEVVINVNETAPPVGDALQDFSSGATISTLDVTGTNLRWYVLQNGEYVQVSINSLLVHNTTYYVSQTLNNCESEFLEVTVNFICPAPIEPDINVELGTDGETASAVIFWTHPADNLSLEGYYLVITDADGAIVHEGSISPTVNFKIVEGLALDEDFEMELYAVCDDVANVYSDSEFLPFDTFILNTGELEFNGFSFYPNPTRNIVTFENQMPMEQLQVFSMTGQKVFELNNINDTRVEVDFREMATGVYFSKITIGASVKLVKIIRE